MEGTARSVLDPSSAMTILSGDTPAIVFLDINMPCMESFEVLAYLRREPRLVKVPVIIITSNDQPQTSKRALGGGADAVIIKRVMADNLERVLKKIGIILGLVLEFCYKCGGTLVNRCIILYNWINSIQIFQEITMPIASGIQAPDFTLPDENNITRRLSDFRGRPVVLYFYPKDDTPGCTTEACSFRDNYSAYVNADVVILGISPDNPKSHAKFKEKLTLQFPLLADDKHQVCNQYGVWGPKKFMGREYEGVLRTTFLIDTNGRIAKVFENVKPAEHSAEVLAAIKSL